ncbi:MAG: thiamine diphosphokinase [Eubacterium sp.]|nr:thiamine diphosphokinase [Eubacterium sp.]
MGDKKVNCIIVSGAPDEDIEYLKKKLTSSAYIIAADSGYLKCLEAGFIPDLIIGDFDSSAQPEMDTKIITLPAEKDDTDTFYCVKKAIEMGFEEIEILCAIGSRADHNYANMLCLEYCRSHNVKCSISNARNKLQLIDDVIVIDDSEYKYFSLFAFLGNVNGLSIKGAYYEVDLIDMKPYEQFAQSNCFKGEEVKISLKSGIILLIQSND